MCALCPLLGLLSLHLLVGSVAVHVGETAWGLWPARISLPVAVLQGARHQPRGFICAVFVRGFLCADLCCVCVWIFVCALSYAGGVRRFVCAEQLLIVCGWSLCALRTRQCARVIIVCVVQALCAVNVCGNANAFVCIYCVRHCVQASWAALCACIVCNALCANRVNNEPSCC